MPLENVGEFQSRRYQAAPLTKHAHLDSLQAVCSRQTYTKGKRVSLVNTDSLRQYLDCDLASLLGLLNPQDAL
jgi:hypothetical protein